MRQKGMNHVPKGLTTINETNVKMFLSLLGE